MVAQSRRQGVLRACAYIREAVPALPVRRRQCAECPAFGMYALINEVVAQESHEFRREQAQHQFCHMTPWCACRGVAEYLGVADELPQADKKEAL